MVVYTLDETTYGRELAPMAGHYPALRLGPPWWFYDSPQGMRRFYDQVVETAGFSNLVGFNDDARSLLTIPASHDVARRVNAGFLAGLVAEHRLDDADAGDVASDLAYGLARHAFHIASDTIVLVGLMGAGKSSVGSAVAARTGMAFVDVDIAIAEQTGKTVRELWEQGGEPAYRQMESEIVLETLSDGQDVVLAAPGGVVLDPAVDTLWPMPSLSGSDRPNDSRPCGHDDHRPLLGDHPLTS